MEDRVVAAGPDQRCCRVGLAARRADPHLRRVIAEMGAAHRHLCSEDLGHSRRSLKERHRFSANV